MDSGLNPMCHAWVSVDKFVPQYYLFVVYLFACFDYLFVCLFFSVCLFVSLSVCLSVCQFVFLLTLLSPSFHTKNPPIFLSAVSCGDPGSPVNGKREGWLFQFGNTVSFKCLPGYELEGPKTRTCLANQTWSKTQPTCKRKTTYVLILTPDACLRYKKCSGKSSHQISSFIFLL